MIEERKEEIGIDCCPRKDIDRLFGATRMKLKFEEGTLEPSQIPLNGTNYQKLESLITLGHTRFHEALLKENRVAAATPLTDEERKE